MKVILKSYYCPVILCYPTLYVLRVIYAFVPTREKIHIMLCYSEFLGQHIMLVALNWPCRRRYIRAISKHYKYEPNINPPLILILSLKFGCYIFSRTWMNMNDIQISIRHQRPPNTRQKHQTRLLGFRETFWLPKISLVSFKHTFA